jgi:hypothetical protein
MLQLLAATLTVLRARLPNDNDAGADRGDVPGWVLITLMTVGIVMALWLVAEPALSGLVKNALNITGDPNGGS